MAKNVYQSTYLI